MFCFKAKLPLWGCRNQKSEHPIPVHWKCYTGKWDKNEMSKAVLTWGRGRKVPWGHPPSFLESWRKRRLLMSRLDGYTPQVISTPADGCWASLPHHSCLAAALQPLLTAAEPKTNHSNLFWLNLTYQSQISLVSFCWVHPRWSLKIGIVWDQKC